MTPSEIAFIFNTIEAEKQEYIYYKDKYALDLLAFLLKDEVSVADLKKSNYGFLTQKRIVKEQLSKLGNKRLYRSYFEDVLANDHLKLNYSLGQWGKYEEKSHDHWYQTSRSGLNLVIQLNFERAHNEAYYELLKPGKGKHPFVFKKHPVLNTGRKGRITMAWARLDVDLEYGEVLIEEVQNDWLRTAKCVADWAYRRLNGKRARERDKPEPLDKISLDAFILYYEHYLLKYMAIWDEALLNLAINFAKKELGCHKIFYHTYHTGNYIKGMPVCFSRPPVSLYTKLPRRFGFQLVDYPPVLLSKERMLWKKLTRKGLQWYLLNL